MTDKQIQRKLNQMAKLSKELNEEALRRWSGEGAGLFFEPESGFHMMSDDEQGFGNRTKHIEFSSKTMHGGDAGAW